MQRKYICFQFSTVLLKCTELLYSYIISDTFANLKTLYNFGIYTIHINQYIASYNIENKFIKIDVVCNILHISIIFLPFSFLPGVTQAKGPIVVPGPRAPVVFHVLMNCQDTGGPTRAKRDSPAPFALLDL